jgi:hypothetical protein
MTDDTYNEETFQYFLDVEQKRSERSSRPFLLLLAHLNDQPEVSARMAPDVAAKLFFGLRLCLRDTDFMGWYRQERVVGAVLTQRSEPAMEDGFWRLRARVTEALGEQLPRGLADRLQLQVHQLPLMQQGLGR